MKVPEKFFKLLRLNTLLLNASSIGAVEVASNQTEVRKPVCIYYISDEIRKSSPQHNLYGNDKVLGDGTVLCDSPSDLCFSYWRVDPPEGENGTSYVPEGPISPTLPGFSWQARGCFHNAALCTNESCVATERKVQNSFFCCCKGDKCNEHVSFIDSPAPPPPDDYWTDDTKFNHLSLLLYIVAGLFLFITIACLSVVCFKLRRKKKEDSFGSLGLSKSPTSPCIDLNNLKFLEILGQGRYGRVYQAILGDEDVAVKLFHSHQKASFTNEKYIYSLPLMEHRNLLAYLGGGEIIGPDNQPCLGLVLSYCAGGNLSSYLRENTLDWNTFCRVLITAVRGLAHLHSDVQKGDLIKPCVSHRDFNTRNLLLKADMSCVVADLGFAIHTQGSKFYLNGEEQIAEMASLTDVGTLRYMAPEVLEGAVNLRDCETSLKQIDIYSLGLVMWEVAYRTHDLYQGAPAPDYALPFQAEIGLNPSFEQMQVLVARNKARPLFPNIWKDTSPAIRQLKETIEDCWDNDAEARLSAMCVESRLAGLPKLWNRYKASLGPNGKSPTIPPPDSDANEFSPIGAPSNFINNKLSLYNDKLTRESLGGSDSTQEGSTSGNTVETTLPTSPSDQPGWVYLGKNFLMEAVKSDPLPALQPHHGRNPCMERNTINEFHSDDSVSSGTFLETSTKYPCPNYQGRANSNLLDVPDPTQRSNDPENRNEHLVPLLRASQSPANQDHPYQQSPSARSLPFLSSNSLHPIPYLKNETRPFEGRSKLQNAVVESQRAGASKKGTWQKFFGDLLGPFTRGRRRRSDDENSLVAPSGHSGSEPPTPLSPFGAAGPDLPSILQSHKILLGNHTNSNVLPSTTGRCPEYGPVFSPTLTQITESSNCLPSVNVRSNILLDDSSDFGLGKLQNPILKNVPDSNRDSKDSGINKSSENSNSIMDSDSSLDCVRRPESFLLPLRKREDPSLTLSSTSDIDKSGNGENALPEEYQKIKLRKPQLRIKTPVATPLPVRLSLCNDEVHIQTDFQLDQKSHSRSLPFDMNVVESLNPAVLADDQSSSDSLNTQKRTNFISQRSIGSVNTSDNSSVISSASEGIRFFANERGKSALSVSDDSFPQV